MKVFITTIDSRIGFTLLELSIVLVIIGLIIGGITVGADLIRGAELNKTISEIGKYKVAFNSFKLKYNELPGLMDNAYDYWGVDCGNNSADFRNGCNSGKRCIDLLTTSSNCNNTVRRLHTGNARRAFIHLNLSGILPNVPYIINTAAQSDCSTGVTSPNSPLGEGTFSILSNIKEKAELYFFSPVNISYTANYCLFSSMAGVLSPSELLNIDTKIDDSNGSSGQLKAIMDYVTNTIPATCADGNGNYVLSENDNSCGFNVNIY